MLREMMWHFGLTTKCYFCKEPLLVFDKPGASGPDFGDRSSPPVKTVLTIHHKNEKHRDNRPKNRKPCHSACHKRYHIKQQHRKGEL